MIQTLEGLSFDDVTLCTRYSDLDSRSEASTESCGCSLPIVMSPMDTITSPKMIDLFIEKKLIATIHRYFKDAEEQYNYALQSEHFKRFTEKGGMDCPVYFAVGSIKKHKAWIDWLIDKGISRFMVDMAMGNSKLCVETLEYIKSHEQINSAWGTTAKPKVIAGNVVTKSGFERLQRAGADGIRVGIGSGSICSTRTNTGFGVPQFTSINACAEVKKPNVMLIADGGIKNCGDMAKAIKAGADMCMCGKLFASTDFALGECFDKEFNTVDIEADGFNNVKFRVYRGMASRQAREGVLNYGSVEGRAGLIKYTGTTEQLLLDIKLNLEASMSYGGVRNWEDFRRLVKVVRVTSNATLENQTHLDIYTD